jgi:signal transduction histidine kinase
MSPATSWPIITLAIELEADIVVVRQRARKLAELLAFERQDQTRIATAVSEIARNAYSYAGGGRAEFALLDTSPVQQLWIRITDSGKGIGDLDAVLEGRHRSVNGMGLGITGARRLLDHFEIRSSPAGTHVELGHDRPARASRLPRESLRRVVATLAQQHDDDPLSALREQNRELLQSLGDINRRQHETEQLNRELADTNRGVVALYAELDERAEQLRRASEIKSRFLSNMSHEFRTPLNSIMALSRLLLDGMDGTLNTEQQRQVGYIRKSASDLLELVSDLLDLAKVEAGKLEVKSASFTVAELFSALRGALKPLRVSPEVELVFEPADAMPLLFTDEGKLAQILRNLISNALKFTERGEVRVSGHHDSHGSRMTFVVQDSGIGIAPADQERIFEEFSQVAGHLQVKGSGTGLGLPLSRQLAKLLGGELWVESELGLGSRFFLTVPLVMRAAPKPLERRRCVLIVDDDESFRYVMRQIITDQLHYEVLEACDGAEGLQAVREHSPDVIVLDLQMPKLDGFAVLRELHDDPATRTLPVIVSTSMHVDAALTARLPPGIALLSKDCVSRDQVTALVQHVIGA